MAPLPKEEDEECSVPKMRGKRDERGPLSMGRQAQMVPVFASTTDQTVGGI